MLIKIAETQDEKDQLDELLWVVLWKPLNLSREIRSDVALAGETIELIAIDNKKTVGGLVAYQIVENEFEIRHLAVEKGHQRKSIGTNLISRLFELNQKDCRIKIQAYVRNESYPFFVKQGFVPVNDEWLEHPDFIKYGIRFMLVEKYV